MKISIDTELATLTVTKDGHEETLSLYGKRAFEILTSEWVRLGWNQKYVYTFSWMGRPVIQLPEDMIRIQEVIYRLRPDVIIETGVAHGGSLIFYASLLKAMGLPSKVVGVDIEIRPHNRAAIESHELSGMITLIEGSSTSDEVMAQVAREVSPGQTVLVILDSNHSYAHVREELRRYSPLVSVGSYIVATDGVMREVASTPRGQPSWVTDNPSQAALDFVAGDARFVIEQPPWPFNESALTDNITHWPQAWIKRVA
jgi:cephalosporin hydroxylase